MKDNAIRSALKALSLPTEFSGVVLVSGESGPLLALTQGKANRAENIPIRPDTRFQTASLGKGFTGLAILQLVEQSILSLDDRAFEIIPYPFPNFSPEVTVHQLLTHTSGITSYFEEDQDSDYEALWANTPMYRVQRPADFMPLFQPKTQKFPPGDHFEYNDGGFILLGMILEAVAQQPYTTYVQQHVFTPAGMLRSGFFFADRLPEGCAESYIETPEGHYRTNTFAVPICGGPDGGVYVTAPDLVKFWAALLSGQLLDAPCLEQMLAPQVRIEDTHYGYGFWVEENAAGLIPYLEGWNPGVSVLSATLPWLGTTITILQNRNGRTWNLYQQIRELLHPLIA